MTVELSEDEALVLFELLARRGEGVDPRTLQLNHVAERNALWTLEAELERKLVAPLRPDYAVLLSGARARVEAQGGPW
jgi:hypothetical protein